MDVLTPEQRKKCMSRIRSKDTKPEFVVRRIAHKIGFRFRLHRKDLPGKPDLTFPSRKKVVFVHGCFWHRHDGCKLASQPKSRQDYWEPKFARTVERDKQAQEFLRKMGWKFLIIWECETKNPEKVEITLNKFLSA